MDITKTFYAARRAEWRKWLKKNYKTEKEIWLVYYKKTSGKPRIEYNDAVEEALCFGWIDSTVRKIDEERFAQRFSRRNPKSGYSQANKERLERLIAEGKVMKEVLALTGDISAGQFEIPKDILKAIKADKEAWRNFQNFSETYKRIRIAFIDGARNRPKEFQKRLNYFIKLTEKGKQFGFGGIEKYYQQGERHGKR
jgi:uncharacterized protein YdeI (YjbR/CyaY-like superfamily)